MFKLQTPGSAPGQAPGLCAEEGQPSPAGERVEIPLTVNTFMGRFRATVATSTGFVPLESVLPVARNLLDTFVRMTAAHPTIGGAVSCRAGCGACCRQLVTVAPPEAFVLLDWVEALPPAQRAALEERFQDAQARIREALGDEFTHAVEALDFNRISGRYFRLGVPCPFLEEESCSVHPERPLLCRSYVVRSDAAFCSNPDSPEVQRIVLPVDLPRAFELTTRGVWPDAPFCIPLIHALDWAREHRHLRKLGAPGTEMVRALLEIMQRTAVEVSLGSPRPVGTAAVGGSA